MAEWMLKGGVAPWKQTFDAAQEPWHLKRRLWTQ